MKRRVSSVLDASALLALVQLERGFERVEQTLTEERGGLISAVNWAEVLSKLADGGVSPDVAESKMRAAGGVGQRLEVRALSEDHAREIARLRPLTRALGLSLGDRACLALAKAEGASVLTTDRAWSQLKVGVSITVIR